MNRFKLLKPIVTASLLAMGALAGQAHAAGFYLVEQSGSGAGNTFAGGAASALDASTIYTNPAGMVLIPKNQLAVAGHVIVPSFKLQEFTARSAVGTPGSGDNGGDAGGVNFAPNTFLAMGYGDIRFGVGVSAPFGLKTEYDPSSAGRYLALMSDLKTVNVNPAIAMRVSPNVSLGFGVNAQYIDASLSRAIDVPSICLINEQLRRLPAGTCRTLGLAVPQSRDGAVELTGNDTSYGWNAGVLFELDKDSRVGLSYRSNIKHEVTGTANFSGIPAAFASNPAFQTGGAKVEVDLPELISLSGYTKLSPQLAIMADVTWTRWSRFKELRIKFDNGAADSVTEENWRDAYRVAIGADYMLNDALTLKAGLAYDKTPVPSAQFRTMRIPDNNRNIIGLGVNYKLNPKSSVDVAYQYFSAGKYDIDENVPGSARLTGRYKGFANILSAQYTLSF